MEDLILKFIGVNAVGGTIKDIERELGGLEASAGGVGTKIAGGFNAAGDALLATGKIAGAATLGIGALAADTLKASSDLEYSLNRLVNDAAAPAASLGALKQSFMDLGPQVGVTANDIAKADYFVQSAGFHGVAENVAILKAGLQTARMTGADTNSTLYSLVTTLNALPGAFSSPQQAAATLQAIVASGVMTFQDLNMALKSGIFGTSQIAGQNIRDIGGLLDTLTTKGFQAPAAANTIRNILLEIPNNANNAKSASSKALAQIGVDQAQLAQVMTGPGGAIKALQILQTAMHLRPGEKITDAQRSEDLEVLDKVFRGTRGAGQAGVMIQALQDIPATLNNIDDSVTHFNDNWAKTQATFAQKMADFHASIYNLKVAIGDALLPTAKKWVDFLTDHIATIVKWVEAHKELLGQIIPMALRIGAMATAFFTLAGIASKIAAIFSSPLILAITAVAAGILILTGQTGILQSLFGNFSSDSGMGDFLNRIAGYVTGTIVPALRAFGDWFMGAPLAGIKESMTILMGAFQTTGDNLKGGGLMDSLRRFGDWFFLDALPKMAHFVAYLITTVIPAVVSGVGNAIRLVLPYVERFSGWFINQALPALMQFSGYILGTVVPDILRFVGVVGEAIALLIEVFIRPLTEIFGPLIGIIGGVADQTHLLSFAVAALIAAMIVGKVVSFVTELAKMGLVINVMKGSGVIVGAFEAIGLAAARAWAPVANLISKMLEYIGLKVSPKRLGAELATEAAVGGAGSVAAAEASKVVGTAPIVSAITLQTEALVVAMDANTAALITAIEGGSVFSKLFGGRGSSKVASEAEGAGVNALEGGAGAAAVAKMMAAKNAARAAAGDIVKATATEVEAGVVIAGETVVKKGMFRTILGATLGKGLWMYAVADISSTIAEHAMGTQSLWSGQFWGDLGDKLRGTNRPGDVGNTAAEKMNLGLQNQEPQNRIQSLMQHPFSFSMQDDNAESQDRFSNSLFQGGTADAALSGDVTGLKNLAALAQSKHFDSVAQVYTDLSHEVELGHIKSQSDLNQFLSASGRFTGYLNDIMGLANGDAEKRRAMAKDWSDRNGAFPDWLSQGTRQYNDRSGGAIPNQSDYKSSPAALQQVRETQAVAASADAEAAKMIGHMDTAHRRLLEINDQLGAAQSNYRPLVTSTSDIARDSQSWRNRLMEINTGIHPVVTDTREITDHTRNIAGHLTIARDRLIGLNQDGAKLVGPFAVIHQHATGIAGAIAQWFMHPPDLGGAFSPIANTPYRPGKPTAGGGFFNTETDLTVGEAGPEWVLNLQQMRSLMATPAYPGTTGDSSSSIRQTNLLSQVVSILGDISTQMAEQKSQVPTASAPTTTVSQSHQPIVGTEARVYALTNAVSSQRKRGIRGEVL